MFDRFLDTNLKLLSDISFAKQVSVSFKMQSLIHLSRGNQNDAFVSDQEAFTVLFDIDTNFKVIGNDSTFVDNTINQCAVLADMYFWQDDAVFYISAGFDVCIEKDNRAFDWRT